MAKSPGEMEAAIIDNLNAKTGKSLEEWIAVLKKSGAKTPKDQLAWLKGNHGLGHFQANVVVKRNASGGGSDYDDGDALVDNQFMGDNLPLKEVYEAVASKVMKMGKDIEVKPCKTYIPFYRKTQFMVAKAKKGVLYLGLPQAPDASHVDSEGAKGLGMPEKMLSAIRIGSKADLTRGVFDRIAEAYRDN